MNRFKTLITISAFSLVTLLLPAIASAQYGGYGNRPYYGNNNDTRAVLKNLKREARDFERQLDRDLDRSRYNGTDREDRLNDLAKDFRNAVNRLNNNDFDYRYNNGRYDDRYNNRRNNRNNNDVNRVFNLADQIDRSLNRSRVGYQSRSIWSQIRSDLNYLGRYSNNAWYDDDDYYRNDRNHRRNGGWNNRGYNRPSWWPF